MKTFLAHATNFGKLRKELAAYKYAFETTAADRDRLAQQLAASQMPPVQIDDDAGLGRYWQMPTELHKELLSGHKIGATTFRKLIETGFVLQYASVKNRLHVDALIDWQIAYLKSLGVDIGVLPSEFQELDIVPDHALVKRHGKRLGSDFLRFLEYLTAIERNHLIQNGSSVVEIGAGYGGLARLIRLKFPATRIFLVDIYETLVGAEMYLRHAFPDSTFAYVDTAEASNADFVFCRIEDAKYLKGQTFGLAINTWSFGEMPNRYINQWFSFLTEQNESKAIFFLNHFMMPVSLDSPTARAQLNSANWMTRIGSEWNIREFAIHPGVHGCEYWRHCQQGVLVAATKFESDEQKRLAAVDAERMAKDVHAEDWAQFSVAMKDSLGADASINRSQLLAQFSTEIDDSTPLSMTQVENVLGIIKDDIRTDMTSALFRLWDHYRLTGSKASLRLLRILFYLKWRPALRNPNTGAAYIAVSGEEFYFASKDGVWIDDPLLSVPSWLSMKFKAIMGPQAPDAARGVDPQFNTFGGRALSRAKRMARTLIGR